MASSDESLSPPDVRPGLKDKIQPPGRSVNIAAVIEGCRQLKERISTLESRYFDAVDSIRDLKAELTRHYKDDHPFIVNIPVSNEQETGNAKANGNGVRAGADGQPESNR